MPILQKGARANTGKGESKVRRARATLIIAGRAESVNQSCPSWYPAALMSRLLILLAVATATGCAQTRNAPGSNKLPAASPKREVGSEAPTPLQEQQVGSVYQSDSIEPPATNAPEGLPAGHDVPTPPDSGPFALGADPASDDQDDKDFRMGWKNLLRSVSLESATRTWNLATDLSTDVWAARLRRIEGAKNYNLEFGLTGTNMDIFGHGNVLAKSIKRQYWEIFVYRVQSVKRFGWLSDADRAKQAANLKTGGDLQMEISQEAQLEKSAEFFRSEEGRERLKVLLQQDASDAQLRHDREQRNRDYNGQPYLKQGG